MSSTYDVVIVGAGLAGLRAAQVLERAGQRVVVVEKAATAGGRLSSRSVDGFLLDEGFQLINPAYPELVASGVLSRFDLRSFDAALDVVGPGGVTRLADPRRDPAAAWRLLRSDLLSWGDLLASARLFTRVAFGPVAGALGGSDDTARVGLRAAGLSERAIENVFRPFLRGTLLDDDLDVSWRYVKLLLRSFVRGVPGTHPRGIAALPAAFVGTLTTSELRLGEAVSRVTPSHVVSDHGSYDARAVIVATDATSAHELADGPATTWRAQTAWWFSTPKLTDAARLRVQPGPGLLTGVLDISSRAPERAPAGRSLVAAPANGVREDGSLDASAREDVARLYGLSIGEVELIERTVVARALPDVGRPLRLARANQRGGVTFAGDYLQTPSIQGALVSGRRAAERVLRDLGVA